MLSGPSITYRQLIHVLKREIAWVRLYLPNGTQENHVGPQAIRESVYRLGDRVVREAMPGYHFMIIWLDREERREEREERRSEDAGEVPGVREGDPVH